MKLVSNSFFLTLDVEKVPSSYRTINKSNRRTQSHSSMERRVRHSVAVDPQERAGMNALLVATDQKNAPRVRAMIEGAANPDAVVNKAHLPLTPRRGGRDWAAFDWYSALLIACFSADLTIAKLLLEAGASTELRVHKGGETALVVIASTSADLPALGIPAAELLLDCGAEVNAVGDYGRTPLMHAARNGNAAMVDTLLARSANVHMKDTDGENALVIAVDQGHLDAARALLEAGADADSTNQQSRTVAMFAVLKKNVPMLELLLRYGASAATAIDMGPLDPESGEPVDADTWDAGVLSSGRRTSPHSTPRGLQLPIFRPATRRSRRGRNEDVLYSCQYRRRYKRAHRDAAARRVRRVVRRR